MNHEAGENQDSSKTSPISRSPSPQSEPIDSSPSPSLDNASDDDLVSPVQSDKEGALSNANLSKEPADSKATTDSEVIKSLEAEILKFKRLHKEDQDSLTYFQNVIHQKDVQIRNLTLRGQRLASLRTPKIKRERKH